MRIVVEDKMQEDRSLMQKVYQLEALEETDLKLCMPYTTTKVCSRQLGTRK
jgi:hypothetical protein